jgi:hypothetical protein
MFERSARAGTARSKPSGQTFSKKHRRLIHSDEAGCRHAVKTRGPEDQELSMKILQITLFALLAAVFSLS